MKHICFIVFAKVKIRAIEITKQYLHHWSHQLLEHVAFKISLADRFVFIEYRCTIGSDEISLNDYAVHVPRGSIISFLVVCAVIKAMHHMCWPADIIVYLKK